MKAITLWQPWATLLACGAKLFETRSWATAYRGPIAIHAAARPPKLGVYSFDDAERLRSLLLALRNAAILPANMPLGEAAEFVLKDEVLPTGVVVATAELVGCHEIKSYIDDTAEVCMWINDDWYTIAGDDNEYYFGDYTPGRFAWEFRNMKMLDTPIPAKGAQGLWNWNGGMYVA